MYISDTGYTGFVPDEPLLRDPRLPVLGARIVDFNRLLKEVEAALPVKEAGTDTHVDASTNQWWGEESIRLSVRAPYGVRVSDPWAYTIVPPGGTNGNRVQLALLPAYACEVIAVRLMITYVPLWTMHGHAMEVEKARRVLDSGVTYLVRVTEIQYKGLGGQETSTGHLPLDQVLVSEVDRLKDRQFHHKHCVVYG